MKVQLAAHRKSSTYWPLSTSKKQKTKKSTTKKTKERERVKQIAYVDKLSKYP